MNETDIKEIVREKYGEAARRVSKGRTTGCCGPAPAAVASSCCAGTAAEGIVSARDPVTSDLYRADERALLPAAAVNASLGCGNPTALAELAPGQTVLDLGSGGGIDVLLSAKRVGPSGRVYGLDMTDEMLDLARRNAAEAGATNVEFLKGELEAIPLPEDSVDVIISNCVINLSGDKDRSLREAFRVLKPGGRFAVSDIVVRGEVPPEIRRNVELWIGCVAGALEESEFRTKLGAAGFTDVEIVPTRIFGYEEARDLAEQARLDSSLITPEIDGKFMSAFVRAAKPRRDPESNG